MENKIEGLTIAVENMDAMVNFYNKVFEADLQCIKKYGVELYTGKWCGIEILLCPAQLAGINVNRNRQQFDIIVGDVKAMIENTVICGGKLLSEPQTIDNQLAASIYDPDGNSIVLKEML